MINLLPDEHKAEIRAGRLNVILGNYIFMSLAAIALLGVLTGLSYITITNARADAQRRVNDNKQSAQQYEKVSQEVKAYRENLAIAKQIMDRSVNYSELIVKIKNTMPPGVVLTSLSLDATTLGTPMVFSVRAKSEAAVLQFKDAMLDNKAVFTDAKVQAIEHPEGATAPYFFTATLSVTVNKEAL